MSAQFPGDGGLEARANGFLANSENPIARALVRDLLDQLTMAGLSVATLLRNAVHNARPRQPGKHVRWSAVEGALAVGSTSAIALCRLFDLDPDEELEGPTCATCAEEAVEEHA